MMPWINEFMAYVGPFLVVAIVVNRLYGQPQQALGLTTALFGLYLITGLLRVEGISPLGYVRGVIGDLSIITLLLLGNALLTQIRGRPLLDRASRDSLVTAIALAALLFYPLALGLSPFDPYRLGFTPLWLGVVLAGLAAWAWLTGRRAAAWSIVIVVAAFDLHLLESDNLWDYMLDPFLAVYAWGWLVRQGWRRRRGRVAKAV